MPIDPLTLTQASFTGMRDSLDPTTAEPRKAYLLQNVYPQDPELGGGTIGRPGFQVMGAQLGSGGQGQLLYQFTKLNGTEYSVAIVGGKVYAFNWTTRAWTEAISAATFSAASITLSTTARCSAVTFNDTMVVSDGVNTPWTWDGTTNGGLTKLTNAPVFYGPMTIYYAKLFGIKNTERNAIVWSEENDPTTGYEAGGFNNAWTLTQTDQEPLHAIVGTNEALYYFRERSTGAISGAVTAEFQSTGTREGVSETVGTKSPWGVVYYERALYFLDADLRPHIISPGGVLRQAWRDLRETVRGLNRAQASKVAAVYYPPANLVLLGVAESGISDLNISLVLRTGDDQSEAAGIWRGYQFDTHAMLKNDTGEPLLCHLSTDGYAYDHGNPFGTLWDDEFVSGTVGIEHAVIGSVLGFDNQVLKHFDRIDLSLRSSSDLTAQMSYTTNLGTSSAQNFTITGGLALWGSAEWGTDVWSLAATEVHKALGWDIEARWIRPELRHQVAGEQFGIVGWTVTAYPLSVEATAA